MSTTKEAAPSRFRFYWGMTIDPNNPPKPATMEDKARALWRFGECNGFVVKDWTGVEKGEPACLVLKSTDIFEYIASAAQDGRKIAIYSIGPCILDWS